MAVFDAEPNFQAVQTYVEGHGNTILPILENIASKATYSLIGNITGPLTPDIIPYLSDADMDNEDGTTQTGTVVAPNEPSAVEIMENADAFLAWISSEMPPSISFPDYSEIVTGEPTSPTLEPVPSDPYTLSDIEDPTVTVPEWEESVAWEGDFGDTPVLSASFTYVDDAYVSPLYADNVNSLHSLLIAELAGQTFGLGTDLENDMFDKAVERETKIMFANIEGALSLFSTGGFSAPTGAAAAAISRIQTEARDKIASASREVMIKRSDMYLDAKKHTMSVAAQVESSYQSFFNAFRDRYLKRMAQEITSTVEVAAYNLERIKAFVEKYKAYAGVFTAQIDASRATVDLFKSRVEAEATKAGANKSAAEVVIEKNKAAINGFAAEVEAYKAAVDGRVRYHAAIADLFRAESDMFGAKIGGVKSAYELADKKEEKLINFRVGKYNADVAATKTKLDEILGFLNIKLDQFKSQAQASASVAAAAMAALNVNLGMNLSGSASLGGSDSYSSDLTAGTTRHSVSTTESTSSSRSWSTSESTSTQTSETTFDYAGTQYQDITNHSGA